MTGLPEVPGTPGDVLEDIPDKSALDRFLNGAPPPYRVEFQRGDEAVAKEFTDIRADYGGDRVELVYEDGRYVTLNVGREVNRAEVLG